MTKIGKSVLKQRQYSKVNHHQFSSSGLNYDGEGKLSIISTMEIKEIDIDLSKQGVVTLTEEDTRYNRSQLAIWQKMSLSNTGMSKQDIWQKKDKAEWLKAYLLDKGTQISDIAYIINKQDAAFLKKVFIKGFSGKSRKVGYMVRRVSKPKTDEEIADFVITLPPDTPTKDIMKILNAASKLI